MVLAAPFLLPQGAGVKGAKKLYRRLRRRSVEEGESTKQGRELLPARCSVGAGQSAEAPRHVLRL